ncbi:hypothetical protein, partial [Enterobacter ludwigii]|uniref:hypothetical protein n=1 Tax=Enterobacter ludwigii TaxID=299767 RepID=UPI0019549DB7
IKRVWKYRGQSSGIENYTMLHPHNCMNVTPFILMLSNKEFFLYFGLEKKLRLQEKKRISFNQLKS